MPRAQFLTASEMENLSGQPCELSFSSFPHHLRYGNTRTYFNPLCIHILILVTFWLRPCPLQKTPRNLFIRGRRFMNPPSTDSLVGIISSSLSLRTLQITSKSNIFVAKTAITRSAFDSRVFQLFHRYSTYPD